MRITFEVTKKHLRRNNKEPLCPVERALEEIGFNGVDIHTSLIRKRLNAWINSHIHP